MVRIVVATVLGGLVLFATNAASWMLLPWHGQSLRPLPESAAVIKLLRESAAPSGVYHYPALPPQQASPSTLRQWEQQCLDGPRITKLVYRAKGGPPFEPATFVLSLVCNLGAAWLAAVLLSCAVGLEGCVGRVLFVFGLGVFVVLATTLPEAIWWQLPAEFLLPTVADQLVGWLLVGLVLAWRIRPVGQTKAT